MGDRILYGPRSWLKNSLEHRLQETTKAANRCARAYAGGPMRDAAQALANAHLEAANAYQRALKALAEDDPDLRCTDPACSCNGGSVLRCC